MNIKKCLFNIVIATGALSLAACTDYDNGYEKNVLEYQRNFEDVFGKIDPNATWNATQSGSVSVSVEDKSQVMIYADGLGVNLQLLCDVLEAGETKTLNYTAPYGVKDIIVIAQTKESWSVEKLAVAMGGKAKFAATPVGPRQDPYNYGKAHLIKYVDYCYTIDDDENITSSSSSGITTWYSTGHNGTIFKLAHESIYPYPAWGEYYSAYPWPATSNDTNGDGNRNNILLAADVDVPKVNETIPTELVTAVSNIVGSADDNQELLEGYTQDLDYMTTTEPGQVELTFVRSTTNSSNVLGYYYTTKNTSEADLKAVQKYILIPNMSNCVQGDKYKLVYFGPDGKSNGTYNFPKDTQIHFFLARDFSGNPYTFNKPSVQVTSSYTPYREEGNDYDSYRPNYSFYKDFYGTTFNYIFFSDSELNDVARQEFTAFNFPATAAFNVLGRNCISFEDWPSAGSIDWNDAVFMIDAPFDEFKSIDEVQAFYIAMEDLGSTDDFDFNDVVLRLKQSTTKLTDKFGNQTTNTYPATVELMAAGGTMPVSVYYDTDGSGAYNAGDQLLFTEVHSTYGVDVSEMVNTGKGPSRPAISRPWPKGADKMSISEFAPKILFCVNNNKENDGQTYYEIHVPDPDTELGATPQAFVIPGTETWQWPSERQSIISKYPAFAQWVADNKSAEAAYWYDYQWGKTYSTGGSGVDPMEPGEGGNTGGNEPGETPNTDVVDLMQYVSESGEFTVPASVFDGKSTATVTVICRDKINSWDGNDFKLYCFLDGWIDAPGNVTITKGETNSFELSTTDISAIKAAETWKINSNGNNSLITGFSIK